MHPPLPQVFVYELFFDANMQAMNDRVATSFRNSYSPPLETGGTAPFLPGSIFFALCIRKGPVITRVRRHLPTLNTPLLAFLILSFLPPVSFATCTAPKNPIEAENCLPGTPASQWYVDGAGSPNIQGFATDISVNAGQTISFKISTNATSYRIDIYRLGYYQGNNGRFITSISPSAHLPQIQPSCLTDSATGLIDCGNWGISASWTVPSTAVSGIYFAKLVRLDTGEASPIIFVVRNDSSHSDILQQTDDTTWQAYNNYGGNSLYAGNPVGRAYKVSYNRPSQPANGFWGFYAFEYPIVHFLEANGYDVSYFTGVDTDRNGALITQHKVFMSVGHDEYWSGAQRANVEAARAAGVNLAFFSGNEVFWKTRWEASMDGSSTPYRTLVCYKESEANGPIDPLDSGSSPTWTGNWRDARFSPPADGGRPENALTGTIFQVNSPQDNAITVPQDDGRMRFWRNTSIATLAPGQVATLPQSTLGYESDEDVDNGFRPAGLIRLSTTTVPVTNYLYFSPSPPPGHYYFANGTETHHLTLYRAPNGALVFGAGTVQWLWGVDADHGGWTASVPADPNMRQASVNLLADMGVQPATLQMGLVPATASTDLLPSTSAITSPLPGTRVAVGSPVTISGNAVDFGGGVVGGVEISVDGGTTWHPAMGRENWNYIATFTNAGTVNVRSRAVDDSGNLEVPGPGIILTVTSSTPPPATPTGLTATAGNAQVSLAWNASSGAASYNLYRSVNGGAYTLLNTNPITTTSYTDSSLTNGTPYCYEATAVNSSGESAKSSPACATPQPPPPPPAISVIQKATFSRQPTSGGTVTLTLPQATGAGHAIIVGLSFWPLDISSVTDGSGDIFTRGLGTSIYHDVPSYAMYSNFYYAKSTAGGATSVTLNFSGGSTYLLVAVAEVAGLDPSAPLDQSGYHESLTATTAWSSAAVTTTAANEYLFSWAATEASNPTCASPAPGWVIESQTQDTGATVCLLDRVVSATGSYQASVTASTAQNYAMEIATFKGAP